MRRRNFLASTFSSLASYGLPGWALVNRASPPTGTQSRGAKPGGLAIICNPEQSVEEAAARELRDFLGKMAGTAPRVLEGSENHRVPGYRVRFLVGRPPAVTGMIARGEMEDPALKNPEPYAVRSVSGGEHPQVVFLGGTGVATLYAVYHYLEKECGVGFFWDGDHVPRRDLIPTEPIDIFAAPRSQRVVEFR